MARATESELVAEDYLAEASDFHNVVVLDDGADYRIIATERCTNTRVTLGGHASDSSG